MEFEIHSIALWDQKEKLQYPKCDVCQETEDRRYFIYHDGFAFKGCADCHSAHVQSGGH